MRLVDQPDTLSCSLCDEEIDDTGYLPATGRDDGADVVSPIPEAAVCGACGFNDVGFAGCAPELDDVPNADGADMLLHIRATDGNVDVLSVKD